MSAPLTLPTSCPFCKKPVTVAYQPSPQGSVRRTRPEFPCPVCRVLPPPVWWEFLGSDILDIWAGHGPDPDG